MWVSAPTDKVTFAYNIDTNLDGFTQAKVVVRGKGGVSLDALLSTVLDLKAQLDGSAEEAAPGVPAVAAADLVADGTSSTLVFGGNNCSSKSVFNSTMNDGR